MQFAVIMSIDDLYICSHPWKRIKNLVNLNVNVVK